MDWWKPWELTTSQKDSSPSEGTANSAPEPQGEPRNYMEALKHQDTSSWERAAQEGMSNHLTNQTWTLVPHLKDRNVIRSRWVFWLKYNADGSIEQHEARLKKVTANDQGSNTLKYLPQAFACKLSEP